MMVSRMTEFHPITKSFWRFLGTFIPSIFVVIFYAFRKESITSSFWPLRKDSLIVFVSLALRSFLGCTAATLQYYSLKYMSLGDSSVICNSYPVFVTILAYCFLKEPFGGIFMLAATLVTFLGVTLIVRPPILTGETLDSELMIGAGLAITCAVFMAGAIVMIRHLKQIHHCITLIGFAGFGTIEAALLAWGFGVLEFPTETIDILKACAIGLLSCGSQMFLIFALKCDNAGPIALVKTTDVVFAFLWQMIFVQVFPDILR
ncbi:unnamed protein product [Orchesella dallaii]|uniref:EamA domain-containing protein n=1 Tax=Orchesella dallaii TaxID=48710 RepID=A0ABP1QE34_9HEXA